MMTKRNYAAYLYSLFLSRHVDETNKKTPIFLSYPRMMPKIKKHPNSRIIINGQLVIEKRGCPTAFTGPVIEVHEGGELIINNTVVIGPNSHFIVGRNGRLVFGDMDSTVTNLSYNSKIVANEYIKIGSDCLFSWDILMMDSSTHLIGDNTRKPILMGNHVWVGARATILKGAEIGEGSIVANGAIVTKSFPPKTLIGGVPAKILKTDVEWRL